MKIHELKCWNPYFTDVIIGAKTFEVRKNDRDYKKGDILRLREYNPENNEYSGDFRDFKIRYILYGGGNFGIRRNYVVMSIEEL